MDLLVGGYDPLFVYITLLWLAVIGYIVESETNLLKKAVAWLLFRLSRDTGPLNWGESALILTDGTIKKVSPKAKHVLKIRRGGKMDSYLDESSTRRFHDALSSKDDFLIPARFQSESVFLQGKYTKLKRGVENFYISITSTRELDKNPRYLALKSQLNEISDAAVITDLSLRIKHTNAEFGRVTGFRPSETKDAHISILKSGYHTKEFYELLWAQVRAVGVWSGQVWNRKKHGETYLEQLYITQILNPKGEVTHYLGIFSNASESKLISRETNLSEHVHNIKFIPALKDLDVALHSKNADGQHGDLILIDIQRYLLLRETIGSSNANLAVRMLVRRLNQNIPHMLYAYHIDRDKVAILKTENMAISSDDLIKSIINTLDKPFMLQDQEVCLSASFGIASFPEDGVSISKLLDSAAAAVGLARQFGDYTTEKYDPSVSEEIVRKAKYDRALRQAVDNAELEVNYQPILDDNGRLCKLEALLRWNSASFGYVSPAVFIPIAEESGVIKTIGQWIMEQSIKDLAWWCQHGYDDVVVSINVSATQLADKEFAIQLSQCLSTYGVNPELVEIEITESVFMEGDHLEKSKSLLSEVKKLGIRVALDDFGTGYSSLSYLKELSLDTLKIDRSFVQSLARESEVKILDSIISLAHRLGLKVVGEGVELKKQEGILRKLGCDYFQGFYYSKPIPLKEIREKYM